MLRQVPDALLKAGLPSWAALADRVGISPSFIAHVRAGREKLSPRVRAAMASELRVPVALVDEILRGRS